MQKDQVQLGDGQIIETEVNGRTLDGLNGCIFIMGQGESLQQCLENGHFIDVGRSTTEETWKEKEVK